MNVKFSIGVVVECFVFDNDSYAFLVRQPNGQPVASFENEVELGSYLSDLRCNVIAKQTSETQAANIK